MVLLFYFFRVNGVIFIFKWRMSYMEKWHKPKLFREKIYLIKFIRLLCQIILEKLCHLNKQITVTL